MAKVGRCRRNNFTFGKSDAVSYNLYLLERFARHKISMLKWCVRPPDPSNISTTTNTSTRAVIGVLVDVCKDDSHVPKSITDRPRKKTRAKRECETRLRGSTMCATEGR